MPRARAGLSFDREAALKLLAAAFFIGASVCFSFSDKAVITTGFGLASISALISLGTLALCVRPRQSAVRAKLMTDIARLEGKISRIANPFTRADHLKALHQIQRSGEGSRWTIILDALGSVFIIAIAGCRFGGIFQNPGILDSPLFYMPFIIGSMTLATLNANVFRGTLDQRADLLELEVKVDEILLAAAPPEGAGAGAAPVSERAYTAAAGTGLMREPAHTPLRHYPSIASGSADVSASSLAELSPGSVGAGPATPMTPPMPFVAAGLAPIAAVLERSARPDSATAASAVDLSAGGGAVVASKTHSEGSEAVDDQAGDGEGGVEAPRGTA